MHAETKNYNDYDFAKGSRLERRKVKLSNKGSRGENRSSKAQSRLILAKQGIVQGSGIGDYIKAGTGLASALMGGGGSGPSDILPADTPPVLRPPALPDMANASIGEVGNAVRAAVNGITGNGGGGYNPQERGPSVSTPPYVQEREDQASGVTPEGVAELKKSKPYIIGGVILVILIMIFITRK